MSSSGELKTVVTSFQAEQVFETIGTTFEPTVLLEVVYKDDVKVHNGGKLSSEQTKDEPEFFVKPVDGKLASSYSIIYLDPDAPSRAAPQAGLLIHGLWASLVPSSSSSSSPTTRIKLLPSPSHPLYVTHAGPSFKRTGHRMIFLLYEETEGKLKALEEQVEKGWVKDTGDKLKDRFFFPLKEYEEGNALKIVGGNFFISENPGVEP